MTISERVSLCSGMIQCCYPVHYWEYDESLSLVSSETGGNFAFDVLDVYGFQEFIREQIEKSFLYPMILEDEYGLFYICSLEFVGAAFRACRLIGPSFSGRTSRLILRHKLDEHQLSVQIRKELTESFESLPIIPSSVLIQYAIMQHYAVTGERITMDLVQTFSQNRKDRQQSEFDKITREHRGVYATEKAFLQMIREGNPDYAMALNRSRSLSSGVRADVGDPLRADKNNSLVLLTLVSRAAMEGGLDSSTAYTMNDDYAARIEHADTAGELTRLSKEMMDDYVRRVRHYREATGISPAIQEACSYIGSHIREKIRTADLAERAGYAEYYFTGKFRKEVGKSVRDYILEKKLSVARDLLRTTAMSVEEVSDYLSFGSRSRFYTVYRDRFGISPSKEKQGRNPQKS